MRSAILFTAFATASASLRGEARSSRSERKLKKSMKGGKSKGADLDMPSPPMIADYLLEATIGKYPGYEGSIDPSGTVRARFNADSTSLLFNANLMGLESLCLGCGVHIHTGYTCEDAALVGGHHWNKELLGETPEDDPWNFEKYQSTAKGTSTSGFVIDSGLGIADNTGRAVVVHAKDGTRVGCGTLHPAAETSTMSLHAEIGSYPGSTAEASPAGMVDVQFFGDNALRFSFALEGLTELCDKCGAHIHTGITCEDADYVLGHYWDTSEQPADPWVASEGAVYYSNEAGESTGSFFLFSGFGFDENNGHAVVFHGPDGGRIGCGTLKEMS